MRKLATVTAAAALVAAMITFPAAEANADGEEVVILKCVESVLASVGDVTTATITGPEVVTFQGTGLSPASCDLADSCAECIKALISENKCESSDDGLLPILVGSSLIHEDGANPFTALVFRVTSVEKYVFLCER